ncbi:unknown [Clostridium sp. CAG:75]|nr:unknown [Clostridium sp. CAG:75]
MRRNEVYHEIKNEEKMQADAYGIAGIIYAVWLAAAEYSECQCRNNSKNKSVFLWKTGNGECRFQNEIRDMVEDQCRKQDGILPQSW